MLHKKIAVMKCKELYKTQESMQPGQKLNNQKHIFWIFFYSETNTHVYDFPDPVWP